MIAETRPMKLGNLVFALALTCTLSLMGASSITNSAVAQAFSPTTTGVIGILTAKAVTREQLMAVMPAEMPDTVQLYHNGQVCVVFAWRWSRSRLVAGDARDVAEAHAIMEGFPLARGHRSRSTLAAPPAHGQSLRQAIRTSAKSSALSLANS